MDYIFCPRSYRFISRRIICSTAFFKAKFTLACLPVVGFILTLFVQEPNQEYIEVVAEVSK